ncbi:MAG: serine/threonine protein kinase/WD40 repeat protein/class 3 adenylate cyclase [Verrucomicrobiales bacterium]|jgi:serine/threonine protein kinase/WD40 repeat protein/class 3 adenylate cyclase
MADDPAQLQLAVLMFTDIVNSVSLQKKLGTAAYTRYISRHDEIFKACLQQAPGSRILNETGDGFLVRMNSSSDAVNTALRLQFRLHSEICEGEPMAVRIGLHSGEITEMQESIRGETRAVGMAINLAARIMDLAAEGQILMTRAVFDDARQFTRSYPEIDGVDASALPPLLWPAFGRYIFKGTDEPMDIYGVGAEGVTPLVRPEGSEKAKRAVAADEEATLGWRPGAGLAIPRREDWIIEKKIGDGGFGEVWLAANSKGRMQRVFKFCFDPDRLRSFKRELTLFRLLQDALGNRRDIAALYEVSVESPPYYLESEYVPTGNISQWADSKGGIENVPLNTRLQILAKAARAAAAAHSVGIIHKDIKPSNILISEESGIPEPRLADFGIGTLADTSRLGSMGITSNGFTESVILESEGSQSFTHLYAPPEYLVGKPASVRGDIYSLGVMLYQLAVGDLNSPMGTGWRRSIPDALLADDIRRCVDVDPERRFQSASHLAEHLEQLDARHAEREEELRVEGLKQNARRRKRTMILTVSISCGLALLTALLATGYVEQSNAKDEAVFQSQKAYKYSEQLRTQASQSDFRLAGQLLARDRRSEALAYLARAVEHDPQNLAAGRKLMATLAMSRFLPLKLPPIKTLGRQNDRPIANDISPDGTQLAALSIGEDGEELHVWNLTDSVISSEQLQWESTAPSERVLDIAFASDQVLCFTTRGDNRETTLHIWEKTPKWVWKSSRSLGVVKGHSGFIANGKIWVREQSRDVESDRRGPRGRSIQLTFHHIMNGETVSLPAPRGRVTQLEGFVSDGTLQSVIAITEMGPDDRTVSIWNSSIKKASTEESPVSNQAVLPTDDQPRRRPENDSIWITCSRGSSSSGPPIDVEVSPNGQYSAVPEPDGSVNVWLLTLTKFEKPEPLHTFTRANDLVTGLRFSPKSNKLAIGYFGGTAFVHQMATNKGAESVGPFEHEGGIIGIEISEDGAQLLTRSLDQTARLWDAGRGTPISEPMRHDSYVLNSALSSSENLAVTVGFDGIVKVWNLAGGPAQGEGLPSQNGHHFSAISPDWKTLFTTAAVSVTPGYKEFEGYLKSWQRVVKGKPLAAGASIAGSRFTSDGIQLIAVRTDGSVTVRNVETGSENHYRLGDLQGVQLRAISGDGSTIAVVTQDQSQRPPQYHLSVWRKQESSYHLAPGIPTDQENTAVALNQDGSRMVTSARLSLQVWQLDPKGGFTSEPIKRVSITSALAMSEDGTNFIIGTTEGTLQWWNFDGTPRTLPLKQSGPVIAVAFAADQLTAAAATASLDGNETARVQVWDLRSRETLAPPARFFGSHVDRSETENGWAQSRSGVSAQVMFSPDMSKIMLNYRRDTTTWDLAPAFDSAGVSAEVIPLATTIGGLMLPSIGSAMPMDVLSPVPYSEFAQLARRHAENRTANAHPTNQVERWADWLLATPDGRHISPTSEVTNNEFTEYLIAQDSLAALHEASVRNPNNHRVSTLYFLEIMEASERSGTAIAASEAAWFAEMSTEFLKSETSRRRTASNSRSRYSEVAKALAMMERLHPDDPRQLEYYTDSVAAFSQALEQEPGDLSTWFATGLALQRIGILSNKEDVASTPPDVFTQAALLIFAMLMEEGYDDAVAPLSIIADLQSGESRADQDNRRVHRPDFRRRRGSRFGAIERMIESISTSDLMGIVGSASELPTSLRVILLFFLRPPDETENISMASSLWIQRAFAQSIFGQEAHALHAADWALKIGVDDPANYRRLQKLRTALLLNEGRAADAHEAFTAANGITSRPAKATPEMVDLSHYFGSGLHLVPDAPFTSGSGPGDMGQPEFAIRPGILTSRQGVAFDVRGIVFPNTDSEGERQGRSEEVVSSLTPVGIPVNQSAGHLHFLHGAMIPRQPETDADADSDPSPTIGEYIIHFEDGSRESVPLRAGIEIGNWRSAQVNAPSQDGEEKNNNVTIAWSGMTSSDAANDTATLFLTSWDNPKPDLRILSLDFLASGRRDGRPFLVAITAQD